MQRSIAYVLLGLAFLTSASVSLADDVGITKARLIQKSEKSYVVEADITQALVWAIKAPIFPDRFQVSELEYINQAGWIVVQATATTSGKPLSAKDELLLPWMRNGASMTVQWLDGSIRQGLFLRSLEGIHIPLKTLMPATRSLGEVVREHFFIGVKHLLFKGIHVLLVFVMVLLASTRNVFKYLLFYTFGQAASMVPVDLGLPGFDLLFTDLLGLILVFLLAVAAARKANTAPYLPLLFLFGLLHGLSYAHETTVLELANDQKLPALFMFNLAVDVGHFFFAGVFLSVFQLIKHIPYGVKIGAYTAGALSVMAFSLVFQEHVVTGNVDMLPFDTTRIATQYSLPVSQAKQGGGQRPRGARRLTNPIMTYLSVEPYEVRQEVLIQARAAVQFLGVDDQGMGSIPIKSLAPVKEGILEVFQRANPIMIDGQPSKPVMARADFVTLGPAGVTVRPEPVIESLDNGIVGLTLVHETPGLADSISVGWRMFSDSVQKVEATTTDPFGGATMILSPDDNQLIWKSRLGGYQVPVIETITIEKKRIPLISILMFLCVAALLAVSAIRKKWIVSRPVLAGAAIAGFVLYPFATYPMDLPWMSHWTPSTQRTSQILNGLLSNVYRAFDVRNESRVYDRLAVSVGGDQLTRIYLENRKALEFENRGGARANVDEVKIRTVDNVKRTANNDFIADTQWSVSGSVNHFGHTHYRQNQYHALVTFAAVGGSWKIRAIELIDEKRVL
ncbi:hypothetical protein D3OALGA1CA_854 [Olavius algarvensis associated proteobacterium Delta 3]|nr:hypothetical protein D3OALGA1CA_854 [Olavius algarvensis associated proteobacterium Delta 3]CAB5143184.1 hypothetical protein D3OALGB2SA_4357 [Olavius algarvensis associated proteobacterium Delta 3]